MMFSQKTRDLVSGRSLAVMAAGALPMLSFAQASDPFDTALASLTTKITSYGGALVVFSAVAVGFWVAMKYVKKIPKAA